MYAAWDNAIYSELAYLCCEELDGQRLTALDFGSSRGVEVHREAVGLYILILNLDDHHLALTYIHHWPGVREPRSRMVRAIVVTVQAFDYCKAMGDGCDPRTGYICHKGRACLPSGGTKVRSNTDHMGGSRLSMRALHSRPE